MAQERCPYHSGTGSSLLTGWASLGGHRSQGLLIQQETVKVCTPSAPLNVYIRELKMSTVSLWLH